MINFIVDGYDELEGCETMALMHIIIIFLVYDTKRIPFEATKENLYIYVCQCIFKDLSSECFLFDDLVFVLALNFPC